MNFHAPARRPPLLPPPEIDCSASVDSVVSSPVPSSSFWDLLTAGPSASPQVALASERRLLIFSLLMLSAPSAFLALGSPLKLIAFLPLRAAAASGDPSLGVLGRSILLSRDRAFIISGVASRGFGGASAAEDALSCTLSSIASEISTPPAGRAPARSRACFVTAAPPAPTPSSRCSARFSPAIPLMRSAADGMPPTARLVEPMPDSGSGGGGGGGGMDADDGSGGGRRPLPTLGSGGGAKL